MADACTCTCTRPGALPSRRAHAAPSPHTTADASPLVASQVRRAASCTQYLGVSVNCSYIEAGMYSAGDPSGIIKWQMTMM